MFGIFFFLTKKTLIPIIPQHILKKYRKLVAGKGIADPEGLDEIIIKEDSPDRRNDHRLSEIVVDRGISSSSSGGLEIPRSGVFIRKDNGQTPMEKYAFERWNDNSPSGGPKSDSK